MIKEKIYGEIVQIIREMYDIQTSVIKDVKKNLNSERTYCRLLRSDEFI